MRLAVSTAFLAVLVAASTAIGIREDELAASRRGALELAGAWSNDGFRLRDSLWHGPERPDEPHVVQVNLFAGNRYWFTAAASRGVSRLSVRIFDETGAPVAAESYQDGLRAAAGFAPMISGPYFVKIEQIGPPTSGPAFSLVYSYK